MRLCLLFQLGGIIAGVHLAVGQTYQDFDQPPHRYFERTPTDRFTQLKAGLESGQIALDRTSEKAFLLSLLKLLHIPVSSQMLVFSTTSLQLSLISPSNPRALYFSEDLYVGYIPGGKIEIVSLDPDLGGVFYIFDIPHGDGPVKADRSTRCMNCHAADETGHVPGLVAKSVVPGPTGGSMVSYRINQTGHAIPLEERFGGWHVTGANVFTNHWGNLMGRFVAGEIVKIPNPPGERFRFSTYVAETSDILAHLVHEHQVGFVNRVVEATYRARTHTHTDGEKLTAEHAEELDQQAKGIVRYMLFTDEVPFPSGGVEGDSTFRSEFQESRKTVGSAALKDWDLKTRLFKYRCSYMIYSAVFMGLPKPVKSMVYRRLGEALSPGTSDVQYAYLSEDEKRAIREILKETLTDLPQGW